MPTTIIQPSTTDTYIQSDTPGTNYGTGTSLLVGEAAGFARRFRGLLKFDVAGGGVPAGSLITDAVFSLYMFGGDAGVRSIRAFRLLRDWVETEATWNIWRAANNWTIPGCEGIGTDYENIIVAQCNVGASGAWYDFPLDFNVAQAWLDGPATNYGLRLQDSVEVDIYKAFYSREYAVDPSLCPKLRVTWTSRPGRLPAYIVDGLHGGISLKATIEQFANEIWVRHTPVGGALTRTPAAHSIDAASQTKFGRKEQPLSGGAAGVVIAEQISDTYLAFQSSPNMPNITLASDVVIKDQTGNVVPHEEVRPNNWMLIENLALPTGQVFGSLIENPCALFLEEVAYDATSGLQITAGRDRFTQALVARIAGRGGG